MAARAGPSRIRGPGGPRSSARSGRCEPADHADVVAIATDGHGPTLVSVDARGEATRPAITFLDGRATEEAELLAGATGIRGWSLGGLPAALWVERHEPAVATGTCWYLSTWEWLGLRLTGVASAPFVPDQAIPDTDLVAAAGIPSDRLPPPSPSGAVIGRLTDTAADALGLRPGIPVVGGMVDAFASYLGAGLLEPGDAYDPGGSAGGFGVYWDRPIEVAGAFVTPAPLGRPVQRRGRDGHDRPGARLVSRGHPRRHDHDRGTARRGGGHPARRRRPRLPPVPRRRALADLGSGGPRGAGRPDAWPRARAPRTGDRRGIGAGHPSRLSADVGRRACG